MEALCEVGSWIDNRISFFCILLQIYALLSKLYLFIDWLIDWLQVLKSVQPLIVYFPDSSLWLSRTVSKPNRKEFLQRVQEMFDQLSGPVVLICGKNKIESGTKEKEKFVSKPSTIFFP